jgi:prepilin-type processing-associated H-X9-DG protein
MKLVPNQNGGYTISTIANTGAAFNYDLYGPDNNLVESNFKQTSGYTPPPATLGAPNSQYYTSYGLSNQCASMGLGDTDKILVVEYNTPLAKVFGNPPTAAPDNWAKTAAPRHSESINVLMYGGHVRTMDMADIDPRDSTVLKSYQQYWLPAFPGPM